MLAPTFAQYRLCYTLQDSCSYRVPLIAGRVQRVTILSGDMAPKRKADEGETPEKKPRAKSAKKEKPLAEPHTGDDGWTVVPPSLLFK